MKKGRLRFIVSAGHSREDIDVTVRELVGASKGIGPGFAPVAFKTEQRVVAVTDAISAERRASAGDGIRDWMDRLVSALNTAPRRDGLPMGVLVAVTLADSESACGIANEGGRFARVDRIQLSEINSQAALLVLQCDPAAKSMWQSAELLARACWKGIVFCVEKWRASCGSSLSYLEPPSEARVHPRISPSMQ